MDAEFQGTTVATALPPRAENLKGRRFGELIVLSYAGTDKWRNSQWLCECRCGATPTVRAGDLRAGVSQCKTCGRAASGLRSRTGSMHISGEYWAILKRGARVRRGGKGIPLLVSIEYADQLLVKQDFTCALSGQPLIIGPVYRNQTASFDRIDSSLGYTEGNVQWVHKDHNYAKGSKTDREYYMQSLQVVRTLGQRFGFSATGLDL